MALSAPPASAPPASAPPLEEDDLPPGWEELIDASGRIYYGNPWLKIVQYERPGMNNPMDLQYLQNELNFIEKETKDLDLALIESNLERISEEVKKIEENLCDKQCKISNESIQSNTLEEFLNKDMNNIFKENN